jgi:TetR/AcrR family fatty acid metabolism transcriptional regulator
VRESIREGARGAYREAILAAAERVFARAGFYETRMADVAKEAGVGVGTLYNYFDSKEVIFADLFAFRNEEFKAAVRAHASAPDPVERLRQVVWKTMSVLEENGDLCSILLERGVIGEYDMERVVGAEVGKDYEEFLDYVEETVRDAVRAKKLRADTEPRLLVTALTGAMNACLYTWFKRGRAGRVSDLADTLCRLFLEGAKAP